MCFSCILQSTTSTDNYKTIHIWGCELIRTHMCTTSKKFFFHTYLPTGGIIAMAQVQEETSLPVLEKDTKTYAIHAPSLSQDSEGFEDAQDTIHIKTGPLDDSKINENILSDEETTRIDSVEGMRYCLCNTFYLNTINFVQPFPCMIKLFYSIQGVADDGGRGVVETVTVETVAIETIAAEQLTPGTVESEQSTDELSSDEENVSRRYANKISRTLICTYAMKYRITGKLGGSFNLANWTVNRQIKNRQIKDFRWTQRQCCSSHACDAKLKSANYVQMAHSPNIILAKFSRYTVLELCALFDYPIASGWVKNG